MPIETNLNVTPFFDDFDETKNFHRVLFRPGYAVQARELTQLQTILQNQIERGFNEIIKDGSVITGVPIRHEEAQFVKVRDRDANNRIVNTSDFYNSGILANSIVYGESTGVQGYLLDVVDGSEAAGDGGTGSYFTLYVQYINSGTDKTTKTFANNEVLVVRNRSDNSFKVAANVITTSQASTSDGFGQGKATGKGFRASVGDGIIYHKGNFIRVAPQSAIVEKYNTRPTRFLGFETAESTVDSNEDASLLDNATGSTNYAAPGAERLKLLPTLTSRIPATANTTTFVTIAKFEEGVLVKEQTDTTYADLGKYIGNHFSETHGDYITKPFNFRIREHLRTANNLGRYNSGSTPAGDANKLVVEIEPGVGYVKGNRHEYVQTVFRSMDKATDYETKDARVISQSFGNYVIVDECVGPWFETGGSVRTVSLRDTAENSITNRTFGATSPLGSEIGTAKIRGFEYHSGTAGTPTGQFRVYLFDIVMSAGYNFQDVKTLYYNASSGPDSLADCVLESSKAVLKETNINQLVFPFAQRGTKTLKDASDTVDTQFVTRRGATVTFSGASNRSATLAIGNTATGGTETFFDSVTSASDRNKFIVIAREAVDTVTLDGTIQSSGTTVTGTSTTFETHFAVGDFIRADGQTRRITAIASDTSLTTDAAFSPALSSDTYVKHYPIGHIFDFGGDGGSSTDDSSIQRTIHIGGANVATSSWDGEVFYNVNRTAAVQLNKVINKGYYVKIDLNTNSAGVQGPWSLGVPDVVKIKNVYRGSAITDTNITKEFVLETGQTESLYGTSKLALKPINTLSSALTASDDLLVEFDYFTTDNSAGRGFFSVDSYPVDDTTVPLPSDKIRTQDIPLVTMQGTGKQFDLRDSIDFRPRLAASATPNQTVGSAPTNPANLTTITQDATHGSYYPTPDENFQADVQFYLNRKDIIVLNSQGELNVVKGVPAAKPRAPFNLSEAMTLATVDIPYYPSLSSHVAKQANRRDLEVRLDIANNRRYTMKDLRGIESRLNNLEYYVSLNALESSAQNKQIFNSAGANRFKNGIFVDNFDGHNNADTSSKGYRAAIDINKSQLRPVFRRKSIPLSLSTTLANTAIRKTGDLITLAYTDVSFIDQKKGTKLRNPVQEITAVWNGDITLNPEIDNQNDVTTLPDIQIDFNGMYDAVSNLAGVINDSGILWGDWTTTETRTRTSERSENDDGTIFTDTLQQERTREGIQLQVTPSKQEFDMGTQVEDVSVRNYMRSREIQFTGTSLKPNTRVYAYFDDELVSEYCTPTNSSFANTAGQIQGSNLVTDSTGTVYGVFELPNDDNLKFRVGERTFKLIDVANTQTQLDLKTTQGQTTYVSTGLDITKRGTSVNVTIPQVSGNATKQSRTNTITRTFFEEDDNDPDPIAQTFTVDEPSGDGIFITKLDLFFGKKSSTAPFTVEIREVENGFPTTTIVPYGRKTLQSSAINVNLTSPTTVTTFTFDTPVFLSNSNEYAIVLKPGGNSQDYALWTAELGATDVSTSETVYKVPTFGVMLTSSNDRTWTAHQKEDLKYKLYRANFTRNTGTFYIENDDVEMFTLDSVSGSTQFKTGEKVRGNSVITVANNQTISIGDIIQTYTAANSGTPIANTLYANGVVRAIVDSTAGATKLRIDDFGNFPTSAAAIANAHNLFVGSTWVGNTSAWSANTSAGFVDFYDNSNLKLRLTRSTGGFSNTNFIGYLRGQVSGFSALVTTTAPDNAIMSMAVPKVPVLQYSNTSATFSLRTAASAIGTDFEAVDIGQENFFFKEEKKVYSKTNETSLSAVSGSKKTFVTKGTFSTTNTRVSPILQTTRSNVIVVENVINNVSTDEHKEVGGSLTRYISKPVTLGVDQDAEDLKVYLHAYKPAGTDVKVYAKVKASSDSEDWSLKDYSPMVQLTSSNTISDSVDTSNILEFEYGFAANTNGQNFLGTTGANTHARLNTNDSNILYYEDTSGGIHASFKTFAIKIVMTSSGTQVVPLVKDMRAVALQV